MKEKKIEKIISRLGKAFNEDERETSILFDHSNRVVYIETTEPFTARRLYSQLRDDPAVTFDSRSDSLRISVPWRYARNPELILLAKYRKKTRTLRPADLS